MGSFNVYVVPKRKGMFISPHKKGQETMD